MYFKKLELVGFKSFMDKTTLHFEPGITAIVGPNGCGKSNVFDSIRWVLGEQSIKSLRGAQMQDVIFNGTDLKQPLGMAEVNLTFENSKRFFSVDNDEVVVTRRIFRSGESEYLLNKTPARLKDILDLFMGTGIGAESYSLVEQGKIGMILSSRPEDRRLVFDEAAGITKYKVQKKEALRKLEDTEQNLLRVNDIITEVKRQIGSLERQANKARRYKEMFEELKSKEITHAVLQKRSLLAQKDELIRQLAELEAAEFAFLNTIQEQEQKINNRQVELKSAEDDIMAVRNEIMNLNNTVSRSKEHIAFNQERIIELTASCKQLETQIEPAKNKLVLDEEKLASVKKEYGGIKQEIENKQALLKASEAELASLNLAIKSALAGIADAKKAILDLVSHIANCRNEIADLSTKEQVYQARKKRLELERAKVREEKAFVEESLNGITKEVESLEASFAELNLKTSNLKNELEQETASSNQINSDIETLEKQKLSLESQREFVEKLKTKYEDISQSLNAVIYLDKMPEEKITGLVVKIKDEDGANLKLSGEAKPFDLDTERINRQISQIEERVASLRNTFEDKQKHIQELTDAVGLMQQNLRSEEMNLVNKKAGQRSTLEQFNKIKEEEEVIDVDLVDADKEIKTLEDGIARLKISLAELDNQQKAKEELIHSQQGTIDSNARLKEGAVVAITQAKAELEALHKRISSDEAVLKILEGSYSQDKDNLDNLNKQIQDACLRQENFASEIKVLEEKITAAEKEAFVKDAQLKEAEAKYKVISEGASEVIKKIDLDRKELDKIKSKLHELQMKNKDIDFKFISAKERMLQVYKIDLDSLQDSGVTEDAVILDKQIQELRQKLDSYGTVNLVAIEEYDELKQRYDFLTHQQTDLTTAKESLHEAILKINRTAKKMFLETLDKVREEFKNYFRLLFNGGDAQIYLVDEEDPLESGIEIICRPPGKKLQNVLLLSGGEKSLSAMALIFAVFKIKPSPFCVLDEIDAALDEANVDRYSRILQDFAKQSQFIIITHNKRTIAKADVMYGITMEESGVSRVVSVKLSQDKDKAGEKKELSGVDVVEPEPV